MMEEMTSQSPPTTDPHEIMPAEVAMQPVIKDPILPCFSLGIQERMEQFLGRERVMQTIDEHLVSSSGDIESPTVNVHEDQLRSFAICGLGGMGKTSLAVEYAYSRRNKYEAIFWLGADNDKILALNFAQVAQQLGLEDHSLDLAASQDVAMAWLSRPLRRTSDSESPENFVKWLIIFDNVDNLDVLADYWPKSGRGSILVTSRDPSAKVNPYVQRGMDLPPLSAPESEALMQRLTNALVDASQKQALAEIAQKLDGLPLAINQVSGVFRRSKISYVELLKLYNEKGIERIFDQATESSDSQKFTSLAAVWALDHLSPRARSLLQIICLLDPDAIPEVMLIYTACEVSLEHYPRSRGDYCDARSALVSSSLVIHNADQEKLSLHRLIQDTVKATMSKKELDIALEAAMRLATTAWSFQSMKEHHSTARFSKCEAVFPSVLRLKNAMSERISREPLEFPLDIRVARLFNDTGWYMFERGLPEETRSFCDLAIAIAERLKGKSGGAAIESIRESHAFIGIALVETNEHPLSMTHKKKWLALLEQRESPTGAPIEDYELGYAYNEIGVAYGNNEMLDEAAQAFRRSIAIFQGLPDYEETMLGWPVPNLGFIYCMQGKFEDAEKALVEILDIHAKAYGVDDTKSFKTGKILYGMGNVLEARGRFAESLDFHLRCFEQFKKVLGMSHHRVGDICHRLAGHCMRQRKYADAEGYLDSALKIFGSRAYLLNERCRTTFKKATLLSLKGQDVEAEAMVAEAYAMRKRLKPRDSRPVGDLAERDFDGLVAFWSR